MQNKIILILILLFHFKAFAVEISFQDIPTSLLGSQDGTEVSFEGKAAIYRYHENKACDEILKKAIKEKKEVSVTINAKKNQILKCD